MKLYLAGPMSRYPDLNRGVFSAAAKVLSVAGFDPFDPSLLHVVGWTQLDYIRWALREMLTCDGIATLPGWTESWGADIEVRTAHSVLLPVLPVDRWIGWAKEGSLVGDVS